MSSMKARMVLALGALLLAGQVAAACVADGPLATARWIFDKQSGFAVFLSSQDKKVMQSFLSPGLFTLLQAEWRCQVIEEGLCAFDFDPWLNADTGQVLDPVTFEVATMSSSRATVNMHFLYGWPAPDTRKPVPAVATLVLVKDAASGCWLLDDLVGRKGQSLRKAMESYKFYP
jgi:hypothetical protein